MFGGTVNNCVDPVKAKLALAGIASAVPGKLKLRIPAKRAITAPILNLPRPADNLPVFGVPSYGLVMMLPLSFRPGGRPA
jgi:hypothetical protein